MTTVTGSGIQFDTGQSLNDPGGSPPMYLARCWVNFDGTGSVGANQTVRGSGNISSITKPSNGNWNVNFSTAMGDANYCMMVSANGMASSYESGIGTTTVPSTGVFQINNTFPNIGVGSFTIECGATFR